MRLKMPALLATLAFTFATVPALAGTVRDVMTEKMSERLFPLFDTLGRDPGMLDRIKAVSGIPALLQARQARRAACDTDLFCAAQALIWNASETQLLERAISGLDNMPAIQGDPGAQIRREIEGVNIILRTYGLGQVPAYPQIDGAGAIDPQERQARLQAADWLARTPRARSVQALDPSIDYALALLDVSDRADAIGHEPLMDRINAPAMDRAKKIEWRTYRYSAMIVTGVGPEVDGMALSPFGKYHLRLSATRFAQGDIPFIILTGGRAHPRATPFVEAEEMRKALIERYGVPEDAILIEPYARHTTTNLRNATRLLIATGAPLDKDALIVCNAQQSKMIQSARFTKRNADELGYQPGRIGRRLSPTELVFRPDRASLRVDPRDPLDP